MEGHKFRGRRNRRNRKQKLNNFWTILKVCNFLPHNEFKTETFKESHKHPRTPWYKKHETLISSSWLQFNDVGRLSQTCKSLNESLNKRYEFLTKDKFNFIKNCYQRLGNFINIYQSLIKCKLPLQILNLIKIDLGCDNKIYHIPLAPVLHENSLVLIKRNLKGQFKIYPRITEKISNKFKYRYHFSDEHILRKKYKRCTVKYDEYMKSLSEILGKNQRNASCELKNKGFFPISSKKFQETLQKLFNFYDCMGNEIEKFGKNLSRIRDLMFEEQSPKKLDTLTLKLIETICLLYGKENSIENFCKICYSKDEYVNYFYFSPDEIELDFSSEYEFHYRGYFD